MIVGIILILVILFLGSVIVIISDCIGKKVGKVRLRLFNFRFCYIVVLVFMFIGSIFFVLILVILFVISKLLRKGVFRIDEI